jgi:Zn-dependent peptidase ImmA (M78 family)
VDFVYSEVERVLKKYKTRDPYRLLDAIGAATVISDEYPSSGLKGYCTILNRTMYAVINGNLDEDERRIVAGHEAAHLIIHRDEVASSQIKAMTDFNLLDNKGRYEQQANAFLADFIVSDRDVMDMACDGGMDFFQSACALRMPAPLFAFKLHSMMRRGYDVNNPVDLDSKFLGK